jgi:diacylglycerol kinase family enzyme
VPGRAPRLRVVAEPAALTVVVNGRASGVGEPRDALERALGLARGLGVDARGAITSTPEQLKAAIRVGGPRRVVLAGGDGSLHAVANLEPPLPELALLPAGKANNVARALGVPVEWPAALALAARGEARAVDALLVETPERTLTAVEGVSAGFHAAARSGYAGENSGDLSAGAKALVRALAHYSPEHVRLRLGDEVFCEGDAAQIFLANLPYFAYGFHVDPVARFDDGLLEAIVLLAGTRRQAVRMMARVHGGQHLERPETAWRRSPVAEIASPLPLVADAEPLGVTTATVSVRPGWLRVVTGGDA